MSSHMLSLAAFFVHVSFIIFLSCHVKLGFFFFHFGILARRWNESSLLTDPPAASCYHSMKMKSNVFKSIFWFWSSPLFLFSLILSLSGEADSLTSALNHSKADCKEYSSPLYSTYGRTLHLKQGALDLPAPICVHLKSAVDQTVSLPAFKQLPSLDELNNRQYSICDILTLPSYKQAFTWVALFFFKQFLVSGLTKKS